jgi:hypothetical protein
MIKNFWVSSVLCFCLLIPGLAICEDNPSAWTGNINFLTGQKFLDDHDWKPLDKQFELGGTFDFRKKYWPVNIAVDILYSWDNDNDWRGMDIEGSTLEFNLGVRKIWEGSNFQPFIGGGLAIIKADAQASAFGVKVSDDDIGGGIWAEFGIKYLIGRQANLGLNLRYSRAEVTLFGEDGDAGGIHICALLGYHW